MRIGFLIFVFLLPLKAIGLSETFNLYDSPQGLAMGNALTADAVGHQANFYNPACLGKATKKDWEITPVAIEGILGSNALGPIMSSESLGISLIAPKMADSPDTYYYHRFNFMPAISKRGYAFSILASHTFAGVSDGTQMDVNGITDVIPNLGASASLAGGLLKVGFTGKAIFRQQIKGLFDHTDLDSESEVKSLMSSGLGFGADIGMLATLPQKWLPSLGVVWKDLFDTRFTSQSSLLFASTAARPEKISQSFNAAFSLHPYIGKTTRLTLAAEWKHIELPATPLMRRLHFGLQLESERSAYVWLGLAQMYWSAGAGLRIRGGNFELGSYGTEIGTPTTAKEDRRFFFRYTLGF